MIRKETENGWILFAQHDHARLAADIMKFWGNSRFASFNPFEEVLFSIQQHDNGWKEWDSNPRVNPYNKYPMNFMEMSLQDQHDIWGKCFNSFSVTHPYASALIALHFRKFNCKSLSRDPENGTSTKMKNEMESFIPLMLNLDQFDKEDDLPPDVRINLRFLQIGDIISLTLCHGWESMTLDDVPVNYNNGQKDVELSSTDGSNYRISPNPFSANGLKFKIRGKKIRQKQFEHDNELREMIESTGYEDFHFTIKGL